MESIHRFSFFPISFDAAGNLTAGREDFLPHLGDFTDLIVFCHGFRNDEDDARRLYTEFLTNLAPQLDGDGRRFAVAGALWPSMLFKEPTPGNARALGNDDARARLSALADAHPYIQTMLDQLPNAESSTQAQVALARTLVRLVHQTPSLREEFPFTEDQASGLIDALTPIRDEVMDPSNLNRAQSVGSVFGFVPAFLNLTTFLLMFERCGGIGRKGLAELVRQAKNTQPALRVHLIGHSLGARAVTACAQSLLTAPEVQVDSMMLLQAAYSHYGLSPAGAFRNVITQRAVKHAIVATHSDHDSVVGFAYAMMAALSRNRTRAIGDATSPFGGIGRNGVLETPEAILETLRDASTLPRYVFQPGQIHDLDGTALITGHSDIRNSHVTWAFANLLRQAL